MVLVRYAILLAATLLVPPALAQAPSKTYAQHLVDQTLATHPDIAIMAMHVTPPKQTVNIIFASNIGRIGKKADADDLNVVNHGKTNLEVNKAGDHFEVELPLLDVTHDRIGALSIVYPYKAGDDQAALEKRAEDVRDQLSRKISNLANLTQPYRFNPAIPTHTYAQQLVDQTMAGHPELLVLMLHVTPPGMSTNVVVASNIGRIGKPADSDDMRAINTGIPNLEVNGRRFEVETRLLDAKGQTLGAVGIVFPYKPGDDKDALKRSAFAIRDALSAKIPSLAKLLEPVPPEVVAIPDPAATLIGRSTGWKPDYSGDFDHFGVDVKGNRLFLAAEDHGTVELFNLKTGQHERTLHVVQTPHAFVYLPKHNRLIITDSGKGMTKILNATTLKVVGRIVLAPGADSAEYDPSTGHLYIVTGGKDVGMKVCFLNDVNPLTGHVYAKLKFDSNHVEAVEAEQHGNRLFVNVADQNYVAVVDKKTLKVITRWPIKGAETNLTMALDETDHRLFVGTRNPSKLFVLNTDTGATVAMLDAPAISDGLFWDSARKRVYIPGGDGYLGVFQQVTPDLYAARPWIASAIGAKSGILVPQLDRLYLAVSPGEHRNGGEILWFKLGK
ncbi:MAG: YncE family protein [Rhodanobacteraceae bacterium]